MPDIESGVLQRGASLGIDQRDPQFERQSEFSFSYVRTHLLVIDIVRTLLLLRGKGASWSGGYPLRADKRSSAANNKAAPSEVEPSNIIGIHTAIIRVLTYSCC